MPSPVRKLLSAATIDLCRHNAALAFIGGHTNVRADPHSSDRRADQLVGQLGEAALSAFLYGSIEPYRIEREKRNANPFVGDDGDLGLNLDVKTSLMRGSPNPLAYNLVVRPSERKPGRDYILGLVPSVDVVPVAVFLVGWAPEALLPAEVATDGNFAGAFVIQARRLRPSKGKMVPFEWKPVECPTVDQISW